MDSRLRSGFRLPPFASPADLGLVEVHPADAADNDQDAALVDHVAPADRAAELGGDPVVEGSRRGRRCGGRRGRRIGDWGWGWGLAAEIAPRGATGAAAQVDAGRLGQLRKRDAAAHDPAVAQRRHVRRQPVVFVLDLADQLLDDVLQRNHAHHLAVAAADQGDVRVLADHLFERRRERQVVAERRDRAGPPSGASDCGPKASCRPRCP